MEESKLAINRHEMVSLGVSNSIVLRACSLLFRLCVSEGALARDFGTVVAVLVYGSGLEGTGQKWQQLLCVGDASTRALAAPMKRSRLSGSSVTDALKRSCILLTVRHETRQPCLFHNLHGVSTMCLN